MSYKLDTKGLDRLIKALKEPFPTIAAGVLPGRDHRKEGNVTNAEIGAMHEFGTSKMAARSWLRVPLMTRLFKKASEDGVFDKFVIRQVIKEGSMLPLANKLAKSAESVIVGGFNSNGYGEWAPHAPGYTNATGLVLLDTKQLRNSVGVEVKK